MYFDNSKYFCLQKTLLTNSGEQINIYKFAHELLDVVYINKWAKSLRNNYIEESKLLELIEGTGLSKKKYLENYVFPDPSNSLGAATMTGEFGELLIYDYIQFVKKYYVARTRYFKQEGNRNAPVKGCDVIGYKVKDVNKPLRSDLLFVAEVKTRSSTNGNKNQLCAKTLESAIKDSGKDRLRLGESLNAEKFRLLNQARNDEAKIVQRFQNKTDRPYTENYFAVAVFDNELMIEKSILNIANKYVKELKTTNILIIYSKELKKFIRELYERACKC